jgi:hypothetical protein
MEGRFMKNHLISIVTWIILAASGIVPAWAQNPPADARSSCRYANGEPLSYTGLLERTIDGSNRDDRLIAPEVAATAVATSSGSRGSLLVTLPRSSFGDRMKAEDFQRLTFIGVGRSTDHLVHKRRIPRPNGAFIPARDDFAREALFIKVESSNEQNVVLRVDMPRNRSGWYEHWWIVVAACDPSHALLGYGVVKASVAPIGFSVVFTALLVLVLWTLAAYVAARENPGPLHKWWKRGGFGHSLSCPGLALMSNEAMETNDPRSRLLRRSRLQRRSCKQLRAMSAIFVSQDGFGSGSLGRLQLFLFTMAIVGVLFYVFLLTGELTRVSGDVLTLLGISAGGGVLSRVASLAAEPFSAADRRVIFGANILTRTEALPSWRQVLGGSGELDVTRLQALAFTLFTVGTLVLNGTQDLANFQVPPQIMQLLGLSQGIYIAGKLIPDASLSSMRTDLKTLRTTAETLAAARDPAEVARLQIAFEQAKKTVAADMRDMFGERFQEATFLNLKATDF